jgi:hypothetical protein
MTYWRKSKTKYRAKGVRTEEGYFASKWEHERWCQLKLLLKAGTISELKRQPSLKLVVNEVKICSYRADASYVEEGVFVVEDAKGFETPEFKLKWKLAKALFPDYEFRMVKR